jgi:hypothetical protein
MRCIHCPTPENLPCAGLDVRRFCELIDPSRPQYNARYREVIVRESHGAEKDTETRLASNHSPGSGKPIIEAGQTILIPTECCGGALPPGIFDEP